MPISQYCVVYYFNGNNFDCRNEYDTRLYALRRAVSGQSIIAELYMPKEFATCEDCIRYRLEKTAQTAKEQGFDCFTTTLTVSPHKNTALVNRIGKEAGAKWGVEFLEFDLKKNNGFAKSVEKSKELGLYRQNYCGCAKSVR
jgi:predicted adenine nucleotide alpha hydrolase (AANH) superfamily ATPase